LPTVLLVEDDDIFRYTMCHYLRGEGYSVTDVSGSMDALKVLDGSHNGIDLVVADMALHPQEPHGFALARMIRHKNPSTRVLFVTGVLDIEKTEPGMKDESILYKPFELSTLSRKVGEMLA
jgi:two-component system, cell cycle sensor histidine kinase and response regulator CckA